jgi:hypothetical protein
MSLQITPQTKVGVILETYPELEEVFLKYSPQFGKLRNPILRRTIARVATLQAAAATAGVDVAELVNALRAKVGQESAPLQSPPRCPATVKIEVAGGELPGWVNKKKVTETLEVDALLNEGEHPLKTIKQSLRDLEGNQMVRIISSFRPEPLLETLTAEGYRIFASPGRNNRWETLIANGED